MKGLNIKNYIKGIMLVLLPLNMAYGQQQVFNARSSNDIDNLLQNQQEGRRSLFKSEPLADLSTILEAINQDNFKLTLAYTTLSAYADRSRNTKTASSGDFDVVGHWDLSRDNSGLVGFALEGRNKFSATTPNGLSMPIGTIWPIASSFNQQSFSITQLWWENSFLNDVIKVRLGKTDPADYINANPYQSSSLYFINAANSDNPAIQYSSNSFGAAAAVFHKKLYAITSINDNSSRKTEFNISNFFNNSQYFKAIELGYWADNQDDWSTNYHLSLWSADGNNASTSRSGYNLSLMNALTNNNTLYFRFSHQSNNQTATEVSTLYSSGVILKNFLNKPYQLAGLGISIGENNVQSRQTVLEGFIRFQISRSIQLTPDIQYITNPINQASVKSVWLGLIRARLQI